MRLAFICRALLALAAHATPAFAAVDQVNLPNPSATSGGFNTLASDIIWEQEVRVGRPGVLTRIDLWASTSPGSFRFFVNRGAGWQSDADDFSMVLTPTPLAPFGVDLEAAGLGFAVGEVFVFGIQSLGTGFACCGVFAGDSSYDAGRTFLNGTENLLPKDIAFRTYVSSVPEPTTVSLLGSGLAVLLAARVAARRVAGRRYAASSSTSTA